MPSLLCTRCQCSTAVASWTASRWTPLVHAHVLCNICIFALRAVVNPVCIAPVSPAGYAATRPAHHQRQQGARGVHRADDVGDHPQRTAEKATCCLSVRPLLCTRGHGAVPNRRCCCKQGASARRRLHAPVLSHPSLHMSMLWSAEVALQDVCSRAVIPTSGSTGEFPHCCRMASWHGRCSSCWQGPICASTPPQMSRASRSVAR